MELTGSLYQDYTNLTNAYNQSGKVILTGHKDVDYHILSQLDLQTLSRACRTNQYTKQLCESEDFWLYKYNIENLDLIYKPTSLTQWLSWYSKTKLASIDANYTLTVYDIQYSQEKTYPPITIFDPDGGFFLNVLLRLTDKTYHLKKFPIIKSINITPNNAMYNIQLNFAKTNAIELFTKQKLIKLLSFVYQYALPNEGGIIVQCEGLPLIITERHVNHLPDTNLKLLYTRKGILDAIQYYNQ